MSDNNCNRNPNNLKANKVQKLWYVNPITYQSRLWVGIVGIYRPYPFTPTHHRAYLTYVRLCRPTAAVTDRSRIRRSDRPSFLSWSAELWSPIPDSRNAPDWLSGGGLEFPPDAPQLAADLRSADSFKCHTTVGNCQSWQWHAALPSRGIIPPKA